MSEDHGNLNESQGHQDKHECVEFTKGYNHDQAKFEIVRLNSVRENASVQVFVESGNTSVISLVRMPKSK